MVNSGVKLLHTKIEKALNEVCMIYKSCENCPYVVDPHSTILMKNGISYSIGCTQLLMSRAFAINESMKGTKWAITMINTIMMLLY